MSKKEIARNNRLPIYFKSEDLMRWVQQAPGYDGLSFSEWAVCHLKEAAKKTYEDHGKAELAKRFASD